VTARDVLVTLTTGFGLITVMYFVALNSLYLLFSIVAFFRLRQHRRRWTSRDLDAVVRSPATPGISLVVPAFNEAASIGESVRALLLLNYPLFEVVVVNDGATDRTMAVLIETFSLARAPLSYAETIATQPVAACYRSLTNRDLTVLDKANGGKADAINAGINAARHPLVCVIDADSLLEEHALTRAVLPFLEDPDTVAAGGIIRIANGCTVSAGRVTAVMLPRGVLETFQVVEYLRAFLAARVAQSWLNALLIISGAFGVFRRDALVEAGGFRVDTVGEDMEIVTRLHRLYRESGRRYRIVFQPEPVCWTEAPDSLSVLAAQRSRWQRGTFEVLAFHRAMLGNPRYGAAGWFAMPFYLIFEGLGPVFEIGGFGITLLAAALGLIDWRFAELLFLAAVAYGALISVMAVVLEEVSFRRYPRALDLLTLVLFSLLENVGYRQLSTWWRLRGTIEFLRRKRGWGTMTRKGFATR
jgi:cellulose synthase/poly-beta-1,6-N-acetylglucosamine synthase-like glycosyltransferase